MFNFKKLYMQNFTYSAFFTNSPHIFLQLTIPIYNRYPNVLSIINYDGIHRRLTTISIATIKKLHDN